MNDEQYFDAGGLDELDTQIRLFQLGIESFSPYANTGKVDMIIRSDTNNHVRYADIKVCSGKLEKDKIVWTLEIGFFLNNDCFLIITFRIPDENGDLEKHHFILSAESFLEVVKKEKIAVKDNNWILQLSYLDLQKLNKEKSPTRLGKLIKAFIPYYEKWDIIVKWRDQPTS
ncbi:MAG: hypothetical protein ACXAB2_14120 [Candidatus Hodarchaeales archaeon]|jgi:hypothetical protein